MDLGKTYKDTITGFTGVAVGHCKYITGCNQVLLSPKGSDSSVKPESQWIDEQRLEVIETELMIVLNNGSTPGSDKAAPTI